jgi:hypothetical protein
MCVQCLLSFLGLPTCLALCNYTYVHVWMWVWVCGYDCGVAPVTSPPFDYVSTLLAPRVIPVTLTFPKGVDWSQDEDVVQ